MNTNKNNIKRDVCYYCRCFLSTHKKRCLIIVGAIVASLILGIITSSGESSGSINYIILMRSEEGFNAFATYFKTILLFLPFYCICLGIIIFPKMKFLGYAMLCFIAFRLGMKITVCITEDIGMGILFICVNLMPTHLIFLSTLLIAFCMAVEQAGTSRKCSIACRSSIKTFGVKLGIIYGVACVCQIVFIIIIPGIIRIFIIV